MTKPKLSSVLDGAFKAGVIAGIGAMVWMQTNYVAKDKFEVYQQTSSDKFDVYQKSQKDLAEVNTKLNTAIINEVRNDIIDIKAFMVRIETKLDKVQKQTVWDWSKMNVINGMALVTNLYYPPSQESDGYHGSRR
jgi:hypothetical protein